MAEAGLENPSETRGKPLVSGELAQLLAQFDPGTLWEALGDSDRATLFAVAAGMIDATSLSPYGGQSLF
jgi:hypothetical protein